MSEKPELVKWAAAEVKAARKQLGLTVRQLSDILRMGENGGRKIQRWESGDDPITGPASVAIEALLTGWRPQS